MHRAAGASLLALMLIAGQCARAAETAGIITRSGPGPDAIARISERRVVVNLAEHTVTGFVTISGATLIANIVRVDDTRVDFTGDSTSSSILGSIDRVTGAATAHVTTWGGGKGFPPGKNTRMLSYYLACKATNGLR